MLSGQLIAIIFAVIWLVTYFPRELLPKLKRETNYQHFVFASVVALNPPSDHQSHRKQGSQEKTGAEMI